MLGAQAKNNEGVPFTDLARERFLLNFWSYVARIYLPVIVDVKGKVKLHGSSDRHSRCPPLGGFL